MLAAAKQVFLERGFEGATLDEVIARAGGSRATLYAQFGDKDGLFAAIIEELCAEIVGALPHLALYRMVIGESMRFPKLGARVYAAGPLATVQRLAGYFKGEAARGRLALSDPDLAARHFLEMVKGDLHTRALFGVGRRASAAEIDVCVRAAARTFCAGACPQRR
ncbi:MAG: transcriptional regulator, TetR family [Rhodospirillales bacterium]|nr:transcriptional regulator, TetR family [Rhodospirillales bacterium]